MTASHLMAVESRLAETLTQTRSSADSVTRYERVAAADFASSVLKSKEMFQHQQDDI